MRKFWFIYLAKAVIVFPGGFGTLDEMMEVLTLNQTGKLSKPLTLVLYVSDYWNKMVDFKAFAEEGTFDLADLEAIHQTDSVDEAFDYITGDLIRNALDDPGGGL